MKKTLLALLATLFTLTAAPLLAQPTASYVLDQTTLSSTVGATDTVVNVASVSASTGSTFGAMVVGWELFTDREAMRITAISGTALTVRRQTAGATSHISGEVVYAGPPANFKTSDPYFGTCTGSLFPYPWINTTSGEMFVCQNALVQGYTLSHPIAPELNRIAVAGGSYTVLPSDYLIAYTTMSGWNSVTLPSPVGQSGKVIIIKDEGFKLGSFSVTLTLIGTVDTSTNYVWTTDYTTSATRGGYLPNGGIMRLYSNGSTSWFTW